MSWLNFLEEVNIVRLQLEVVWKTDLLFRMNDNQKIWLTWGNVDTKLCLFSVQVWSSGHGEREISLDQFNWFKVSKQIEFNRLKIWHISFQETCN